MISARNPLDNAVMSTRVQKGSIIFRPVAKARPRPAESSLASTSQEDDTLHPPPEAQKSLFSTSPEDSVAVAAIPTPATVPLQVSPQRSINPPVPVAIPNTTKQGVPIIISSSAPVQLPPPFTIATSAGPSNAELTIVEQTSHHQGRRRSRSGSVATTFTRKVRGPTTPAFDADADPGEDLDPTSVTMAALCEDTGKGRVSSKAAQIMDNHLAWKKSNKERRAKMKIKMEAKKYGRDEDRDVTKVSRAEGDPEQTPVDVPFGPSSARPVSVNTNSSTIGDASGQGFDYSENVSTSRYNVQVRIGPNGETIIDEESLFVDRNAEEDTTEYAHVEESDVTKFVNSATYSKRFRGSRWSAEETELFYDALSQFGENYELISYMLPGRDRKACKNKFKSEDKKNPQRINYCLKIRKPYDMQALSRMTGKDFSGPTPEIQATAAVSLGEPQKSSETDQSRPPKETRR